MVIDISDEELALMFKALGEPTRLGIFQMRRCCAGEQPGVEVGESGELRPEGCLSVGQVCCRIGGSMSTISHHLKEIRLAGLIGVEKRGRWICCRINPEALARIRTLVDASTAGMDGVIPEAARCCEG